MDTIETGLTSDENDVMAMAEIRRRSREWKGNWKFTEDLIRI